jgi:GNAT superfamily N-acetyltransferase
LSKAPDTAAAARLVVRRAEVADARAVARLIEPAFVRFIAPSLSTVGQVAFRLYVTDKALRARLRDGAVAWCAVSRDDAELRGYAELRGSDGSTGGSDHLTLLFTGVEHQGRGIARRLLEVAVTHLRLAEPPVEALTVNASAYALPIYERLGFVRTSDAAEFDGIAATPMRFTLSQSRPDGHATAPATARTD